MATNSNGVRKFGRIGIILVGRGLAGALHVGQLNAFLKRGLLGRQLAYVQGSSSGAMTASSISTAQSPEEMSACLRKAELAWTSIDREGPESVFGLHKLRERFGKLDFSKLLDVLKGKDKLSSLLKTIHLRDLIGLKKDLRGTVGALRDILEGESLLDGSPLERLTADYDPALALTSYFQFDVTVFKETNGKDGEVTGTMELLSPRDFADEPGLFVSAPRASASLRPFFPKVKIRGVNYCDARSMSELAPGIDACDTVFVLFTHERDYAPRSPAKWLYKNYGLPRFLGDWIFQESVEAAEIDRLKLWALCHILSERGGVAYPMYVPTSNTLSSLSFRPGELVFGMDSAEAATDKIIDELI